MNINHTSHPSGKHRSWRTQTGAQLIAAAFTVLALTTACESNANDMGKSLMPGYTELSMQSQTYDLKWQTVSAGMGKTPGSSDPNTSYNNIYVTSNYGYLGNMPNSSFGGIRCEYLTQLYCPKDFKFNETPIGGKIDSVFVSLYYNGFTGDSLANMEVRAYRLNKSIPFDHYSISDPTPYTEGGALLGRTSYNAGRGSTIIRGHDNSFTTVVQIPVPRELGQEIYDRSRKNDPIFASQDAFNTFFPGLYITTKVGTGSILRVHRTALTMFYTQRDTVKTKKGDQDSIVYNAHVQQLVHTSEVPQLALFAHKNLDKLTNTEMSTRTAYIKSPAGVVTELTLPTRAIKQYIDAADGDHVRTLNSLPLTLSGEPNGTKQFDLALPDNLILLPKDSVASFFEKERTELTAPYTSFLSSKASDGSTIYIFGNLASMVNKHMESRPNEDLVVWVIPVDRTASQAGYNSESMTTSISNLILPRALKLDFSGDNAKVKAFIAEKRKGAPF